MGKLFGLIIYLFAILLSIPMMLVVAASTVVGEWIAKKKGVF